MAAGSWLVFTLAAAAALVLVRWFYRHREIPGRGRNILALLRGAAIVVLLLVVLNPRLPRALRGAGDAVLVDASLSMSLPADSPGTRWMEAVQRARALGHGSVIVFGNAARQVSLDSLANLQPAATRSHLLPAVQAVAESGRGRATVLTDLALDDATEVVRWAARLGVQLRVQPIGRTVVNRGLLRVAAPSWVETGRPVEISFEIGATGMSGGPVVVQARQADRVLAETAVEAPAEGRVAAGLLRFDAVPPQSGELARYDIVIQSGDVMPDDNVRTVYVRVSSEPQGAVLLSFQPDWELRFLQPVIQRALGMPVRGYLRMTDHWRRLGSGLAVGERASDEEIRRVVTRAEMLLMHGYSGNAPAWVRDAAGSAPRVMVFPAGSGQVPGLSLEPTGAVAADWYLADEIPPSPVAPLLASLEVREVPPLSTLRIPGRVAGSWAPILVSRGRRGPSYPVAIGGTTAGRRWVVALGQGYWRWAFWSDKGRDVYDRLFSALASWLVAERRANGPDAIGPADRVVPRGAAVRWVAGGLQADSLRIRIGVGDGVALNATLVPGGADTVATPVLPPGHYTYQMTAYLQTERATGAGEFTVESFSEDFTRPAIDPAALESAPTALGQTGAARTPLHATVWPWALLLVLLSAEWVLRRRWGLR